MESLPSFGWKKNCQEILLAGDTNRLVAELTFATRKELRDGSWCFLLGRSASLCRNAKVWNSVFVCVIMFSSDIVQIYELEHDEHDAEIHIS